uniref:GK21471 n=1 Tax=Drosophila willistoni TaxID=7260 RepID=B4MQ82_DROWI
MWRHLIVLGLLLIQSFVKATLIFETNSEFGMGDDWQDSYLTYSTTGGEGRSVKNKPKRSLTIMSRTNFYTMLKDKLER